MKKKDAKLLVEEVLESSFSKENFLKLLRNLLKTYNESKKLFISGSYIKENFRKLVKNYERVGTYTDPQERKIDLLIVYLQKESSFETARASLRSFVAYYLKTRGEKDAALVAFVPPSRADWRFSFVKMVYQWKDGKVKTEFTPARRYSFLVGRNESSHTAKSNLLPILLDDNQKPTLKDIENAFSIERVTKEFYLKYRELFIHTKEALDKVLKDNPQIESDFESNGIDTVNFAKKLLGQIVFLYFLQKKGWLGVESAKEWGTGSKHFLRELFEGKYENYRNFFNDILEPLFYEALREDRSYNDYYYSRFDCRIPFLNGGLFDPIGNYDWVHTDINLPNELFSNHNKTNEGNIGDGILDVFDRYNFTVKEDEPLEKEVAIDQELLGKIYEKLNAIRKDNFEKFKKAVRGRNENKFNKEFGVYYTPP